MFIFLSLDGIIKRLFSVGVITVIKRVFFISQTFQMQVSLSRLTAESDKRVWVCDVRRIVIDIASRLRLLYNSCSVFPRLSVCLLSVPSSRSWQQITLLRILEVTASHVICFDTITRIFHSECFKA